MKMRGFQFFVMQPILIIVVLNNLRGFLSVLGHLFVVMLRLYPRKGHAVPRPTIEHICHRPITCQLTVRFFICIFFFRRILFSIGKNVLTSSDQTHAFEPCGFWSDRLCRFEATNLVASKRNLGVKVQVCFMLL